VLEIANENDFCPDKHDLVENGLPGSSIKPCWFQHVNRVIFMSKRNDSDMISHSEQDKVVKSFNGMDLSFKAASAQEQL
jgi:hypothetical protein